MKFDNQLNRMKGLMNYGLQTESKNQYKNVEFQKVAADGKTYGIVREGAKFYIKVADKTKNVLKEDFNYVGGFMNRKNYEYSSYANALKNFEMKMNSINESVGNKTLMVETWNPEKKEMVLAEASDKMKKEIARQRQIMGNAAMIMEKKNYEVNLTEGECCGKGCKVDAECASTQKNNKKTEKHDSCGDPTGNGGDPFTQKADSEFTTSNNIKNGQKPVTESEEVLGWNDNKDYLDTSHGTEVGDDAPFDAGEGKQIDGSGSNQNTKEMKKGVVEECDSMIYNDNQNNPTPGVGEIGDDAPFDGEKGRQIDEAFEDDAEDVEGDEEIDTEGDEFGDEEDFASDEDFDVEDDEFDAEDEDFGDEEDFDSDLEDEEGADFDLEMEEDNDIEGRLSSIEDLVSKIADELGVGEFDDDTLYDDEEDDFDVEDDEDFDTEDEDFGDEEDFDVEDDEEEEEMPMESRRMRGRKNINEDRLDYFGKHPAYRKEPMKYPTHKHQEFEDYYDMNDETAKGREEYGKKIGSSAPFEIDPQAIDNAIAESLNRMFGKKKI